MRVVVTGVNGFVGGHLVRELVSNGHSVVGVGTGTAGTDVAGAVERYVEQDLAHRWPEDEVAEAGNVDAIVHLAGLSAVGPSFADPQGYLTANSAPVTHLGESLLRTGARSRVVVVSTGAVYAPGLQIDETAPVRPTSPYAVSKLVVETQCAYYRQQGLDVVVMRPFNHIGPGQRPGFLLPDLIAGIEAGALVVGDLDTRRDYTDVRDVARAYRLVVEAGDVGEPVLNVCSGVSLSGREMLALVVSAMGVGKPPVDVDPARLRPGDAREITGDASLARHALGWEPVTPVSRTVADVVAAGTGG